MSQASVSERCSELNDAAIDLLVSAGMISSVMPRLPQSVQDNYAEKLESLERLIREETREIQMFGEAYDESPSE